MGEVFKYEDPLLNFDYPTGTVSEELLNLAKKYEEIHKNFFVELKENKIYFQKPKKRKRKNELF